MPLKFHCFVSHVLVSTWLTRNHASRSAANSQIRTRVLSFVCFLDMYDAILELLSVVILLRLAHQPPPVLLVVPFWSIEPARQFGQKLSVNMG